MSDRGRPLSLFGEAPLQSAIRPAELPEQITKLAEALPQGLRLGTSSWSFPGWEGLVYRGEWTPAQLAKAGLTAYAAHPLMNTVGLDRTYYAPLTSTQAQDLARQTPEEFAFLVKAPQSLLMPHLRDGSKNPRYLDPIWAKDVFLDPLLEGLADKLGPVLFQFSPGSPDRFGGPEGFAAQLGRFLSRLPPGIKYAVELRSRGLYTRSYAAALRARGAAHCLNIFPRMPALSTQLRVARAADAPFFVCRWMLHPSMTYTDAKRSFQPFTQIQAADDRAVRDLVEVLSELSPLPGWVIVNNKAEGSSPLSVIRLAKALTLRQ